MTNSTDEMKAFLYQHIPLAVAMQVNIDDYDGQHLVISAPLAVNNNDKGTAFAGSISSLATVSGWIALIAAVIAMVVATAALARDEADSSVKAPASVVPGN